MSNRSALARQIALVLIVLMGVLVLPAPLAAQRTPSIVFAADIPAIPAKMRLFTMTPTAAPVDFINEKLAGVSLPKLAPEGRTLVARGATGADPADRVRARIDSASGDAHFIPNFADLVAAPRERIAMPKLVATAEAALRDVRFLPKDATEIRLAEPVTVMGGASNHGAAGPRKLSPHVMLTIVPALRFADGFPVLGIGSHAAVSLANDGTIVGALRRWRTAAPGAAVEGAPSADQIRADIERQLAPQVEGGANRVSVDKIEVAYYDGGAGRLSPVIHFEADVTSSDPTISDTRVDGYVPIGKSPEPIPDLATPPTGARPHATPGGKPPASGPKAAGTPDDISLGEFVNQDWPNNPSYEKMANTFFGALALGPNPVSRTIWWTAYPWQVVGPSSTSWMNAVNVAYTVPHGGWLGNTTLRRCCDSWHVPDIGTGGNPGFGHAAGGVLATWIIMSCEVIPSSYDRQYAVGGTGNPDQAFDAWWGVFQGLHNVIGFRTTMIYPDDALQFAFGTDASLGGDVNAAWFDEVAAVEAFRGTYTAKKLIGSPQVHLDRASTMIDARDLGHSIFNVDAHGPATTLWNFWMDN